MCGWSLTEAANTGVRPLWSLASTSAPFLSKRLARKGRPARHAKWRGGKLVVQRKKALQVIKYSNRFCRQKCVVLYTSFTPHSLLPAVPSGELIEYGRLLESIFPEVWADDRTETFLAGLQKELHMFEHHKASFIQEFSEKDFEYLHSGWEAKIKRVLSKEQCWGLFLATKER
ncbi:unnamed protein product [Cyprideis torosa]|uniref:phosphoethanolamine N-methyltransferase n=1 Tax=Cyprideis torosa TaxID=163714 RepID=A0A7R8ZQE5_9CRUS|nr:unnamed protein product [Cyprideis torosa]CAG0896175.1 unnamed protein product [Cyprideis torosa]